MSDPHTYTIRPLSRDEVEHIIGLLNGSANKGEGRLRSPSNLSASVREIWRKKAIVDRSLARELLSVMEATDDARAAICGAPCPDNDKRKGET